MASQEHDMRFLSESYRGLSLFVAVNTDRLLVPVLIVGALTLAGWLVSLLQTI
jgi:hypothetical protein